MDQQASTLPDSKANPDSQTNLYITSSTTTAAWYFWRLLYLELGKGELGCRGDNCRLALQSKPSCRLVVRVNGNQKGRVGHILIIHSPDVQQTLCANPQNIAQP